MEQPPFPQDGCRQRRENARPRLESRVGRHEDVRRRTSATQHAIGKTAASPLGSGIVRNHKHEVVVAVWSRLTACHRPEQVDTLRLIRLDQALDYVAEPLIAAERLEGFDRNRPTTQLLADDAKLGKQLLVREHASLPVAAAFYLHRSVRP